MTARGYIYANSSQHLLKNLAAYEARKAILNGEKTAAEADVLLAITEWITGEKKEAQNRLLGVLSSMQQYGFTRVIANEQSKHFKGLACNGEIVTVKLSSQQKRILELLSKGYKNVEIIAITGLSLNTIRTHTKVVYQKLEVNNAMDAIMRAKQLGMLE